VIEVNRDQVVKSFADIDAKAQVTGKSMESSFQRATKAIKLHRDEIQKVGMGFAAAGAVIIGAIGMMAKSAIEEERSAQRLTAVLRASNAAADPKPLLALADALSTTTRFSHEATESMMSMLAAQKFTGAQILRLTPLVQNLSVMFGKDLDVTAKMLGITLTKFTNTMTRMGLTIPPAILATKDLNLILSYLEQRSAGVAARMGEGADAIVILQNQIGEVGSDIGSLLLPELTGWINKLRGVITEVRTFMKEHGNFSRTIGTATLDIGLLSAAIGAVALALPRVIALFSGPAGWAVAIGTTLIVAIKAALPWIDKLITKLNESANAAYLPGKGKPLPGGAPPKYRPVPASEGATRTAGMFPPMAADMFAGAAGGAYAGMGAAYRGEVEKTTKAIDKQQVSIENVTESLDKMERRYASHITTQGQLTAGVDGLIKANVGWLRGTEAGIDELGKLYARSKALHDEQATAAKKIADDEKRTETERLAARKAEIQQNILAYETMIQEAELSGKKMSPETITAGWQRILTHYQDLLMGSGTMAAKFPELHKQIQDKILGISRATTEEQKRLAKEWLDQYYQDSLDEAATAEELAKRKTEIDRSYNEARQQFLLDTGQMTKRQYEEMLAAQERALIRTIELYKLSGAALADLQQLEMALMQLQTERHLNNEQIAADNEKAISQQDQIRVYLDRMAEEMSKPQKVVLHGWAATMKDITEIAKQAGEEIQRAFANAVYGMMKHMGSLREFLINVWDIILSVIANVIAKIVAKWIDGIAKMKKAQGGAGGGGGFDWVGTAISVGLGFLGLQHGGLVTRPTMAMIGEAGPEAVIPLSKLTSRSPLELGLGAPGAIAAQGTTIGEFHYHQTNNLTPDALDPVGVQRLSDRLMNSLGRSLERGLRLTPVGAR